MRRERDAVVVHPAQVGQAEDLEAARIGEDRSIPGHESMQSAEPRDPLGGGPKVEVVGVSEDHLGTGGTQIARGQRLHGGLGADRHELGRVDNAMQRREAAEARAADGGRLEGIRYRDGC